MVAGLFQKQAKKSKEILFHFGTQIAIASLSEKLANMKYRALHLIFFAFLSQGLFAYFPEKDLGPLFSSVQLEPLFCDSKVFVDCDPKCLPCSILEVYLSQPGLSLEEIVSRYFILPQEECDKPYSNEGLSFRDYIVSLWPQLTRHSETALTKITTLLALPGPYVIPGARFREMYYWDSYFIMLGLDLSGRWDLVEAMMENFSSLIQRFGFIPNGSRSYYLTRSHPPFFSLMVRLYIERRGMCESVRFLPALLQEYNFWMQHRAYGGLNHYDDAECSPRPESYLQDVLKDATPGIYRNVRAAAESGWDFSSRWLDENNCLITSEILPVDLNCLLYHLEKTIAELSLYQGGLTLAIDFFKKAEIRKQAVRQLFWDEKAKYFQDIHHNTQKFTDKYSLAGVFPLLFGIADNEQAAMVATFLKEHFLYPGGFVTSLEESGQQWDFPNGWAPLQWAAVLGLKKYNHHGLAHEVMQRWLFANEVLFHRTGFMHEKYNVVNPSLEADGGEYTNQIGFGWTNGVALYFLSLLEMEKEEKKENVEVLTKY